MGGGFVHQLRVLYGDTDTAGIVYHANYLRYFEAARGAYLRALGLPYAELERRGMVWPIVESRLRHRRPARYDDLLSVHARITQLGAATITFVYEVRSEAGEVLTEGETQLACTRRGGGPIRIPPDVREVLSRPAPPSA